MRILFSLLLLVSTPALAKSTLTPVKLGKVYRAVDGLAEVTVVELEPVSKGDVLLMVDHANSALDGLILRHKTQTQGTAQAYVTDIEGERTRMRAQDGYWYKQYALYLPESPTKEVVLQFHVDASKALDTKAFVKKFKAQDQKELKKKLAKVYP